MMLLPFRLRSPMHTAEIAFPTSAPSACRLLALVLLVDWASARCPQGLAFLPPPFSSCSRSRPYYHHHHTTNPRAAPRTNAASTGRVIVGSRIGVLAAANDNNQENEDSAKRITTDNSDDVDNKLAQLGYTPEELRRRRRPSSSETKEDIPVQVNLLPEVDAVTLTAVGFGLIAFNFFILANSGDGGLAGAVATIINLSKQ